MRAAGQPAHFRMRSKRTSVPGEDLSITLLYRPLDDRWEHGQRDIMQRPPALPASSGVSTKKRELSTIAAWDLAAASAPRSGKRTDIMVGPVAEGSRALPMTWRDAVTARCR